MARLITTGLEIGVALSTAVGSLYLDGKAQGTTVSADATLFHSGLQSIKCDTVAQAGATPSFILPFPMGGSTVLGVTYYTRVYYHFSQLATDAVVFQYRSSAANDTVNVHINSSGQFTLFNRLTQVGSTSSAVATGGWHYLEVAIAVGGSNNGTDSMQAWLDGNSFASSGAVSLGTVPPTGIRVGWISGAGIHTVLHVDDIGINDSTGSNQNSQPGSGSIALLKPISDNTTGNWSGGAGGATNLWQAIRNTPPVGLAVASETNTSQINQNAANNTIYQPNLATYASSGVTGTVVVVQVVLDEGQAGTTGLPSSFKLVSNPAQAGGDSFYFGGASGTVVAVGTWPTGWSGHYGTAQYNPSVTLTASPVLSINGAGGSGVEADVDFMGLYVEYSGAASASPHRLALMGVGH